MPMQLYKDIFVKKYMFLVEIWVWCGLSWKIARLKILQLPMLCTQFLYPGYELERKHKPSRKKV